MVTQLEKAAGRWAPAVRFEWDNGASVQRYVRTEEAAALYEIDGSSQIWLGEPRLNWSMKKELHGGTRDTPFEVEMPRQSLSGSAYEPLASMVSDIHAPVTVHLYEVNFEVPSGSISRCAFVGLISKTTWRPLGRSDLVKAEIVGRKARLKDVPLGIVATDRCAWTFGDITCGKTLASIDDNATVDSIDGTNLYVNGLANKGSSGGGNGYYTRGYVEFEGLRILIRSHVENGGADPTQLRMAVRPPSGWDGQTVLVVPGCDKSVAECQFWDGQPGGTVEENFGGFGRKMPKYHPVIEDGAC